MQKNVDAFIRASCGSASKAAADRWLRILSAQELARLTLTDVLQLLEPMKADEIDAMAAENEAEARGE